MEFERHDAGASWLAGDVMFRCSHALVEDGRVWLVDPVDVADAVAQAAALGEPAGVLQLLDRHNRACGAFARRLGVRHHQVPFEAVGPFEVVPILRRRHWQEVALWWPERRVLVAAEVLGTLGFFTFGRAKVGVHPLLRLKRPRLVERFDPDVVLVSHGEGVTLRETGG